MRLLDFMLPARISYIAEVALSIWKVERAWFVACRENRTRRVRGIKGVVVRIKGGPQIFPKYRIHSSKNKPTRCHCNLKFISWLIDPQHVSGIIMPSGNIVLLMMGIMMPETCWGSINHEINFRLQWHIVGLFLLDITMHGHSNIESTSV